MRFRRFRCCIYGLKNLAKEKTSFLNAPEASIELDKFTYIVERQLKPEARKRYYSIF